MRDILIIIALGLILTIACTPDNIQVQAESNTIGTLVRTTDGCLYIEFLHRTGKDYEHSYTCDNFDKHSRTKNQF